MSKSLEINDVPGVTAIVEDDGSKAIIYGSNEDGEQRGIVVDASQFERLGKFLLSKSPVPMCDIDAVLDCDSLDANNVSCKWDDENGLAMIFGDDDRGELNVIALSILSCKLLHAWLGNVIRKHSDPSV
jgi:hypothetical protein